MRLFLLFSFLGLVMSCNSIESTDSGSEQETRADGYHIVVIGSSTAEGVGASVPDSAWVNRYRAAVQSKGDHKVTNLSKGGYTTYHLLPDAASAESKIADHTIDPERNISKALSLDPDAVIVNLPSNDAARNYSVHTHLTNFSRIANEAEKAGVPIWICTTQPRNFEEAKQIETQVIVRDSIFSQYDDMAIDFWNGTAGEDGFILKKYDSGDGIHLNDGGHRLLFERVLAKNILNKLENTH
ncbi:MAG: SGNH/GDSL hydrolase family protein [Bacteroidetes bacterium]|nr:SGNH/GDSL hydrolase family protein [Bacteroidota bacterium]